MRNIFGNLDLCERLGRLSHLTMFEQMTPGVYLKAAFRENFHSEFGLLGSYLQFDNNRPFPILGGTPFFIFSACVDLPEPQQQRPAYVTFDIALQHVASSLERVITLPKPSKILHTPVPQLVSSFFPMSWGVWSQAMNMLLIHYLVSVAYLLPTLCPSLAVHWPRVTMMYFTFMSFFAFMTQNSTPLACEMDLLLSCLSTQTRSFSIPSELLLIAHVIYFFFPSKPSNLNNPFLFLVGLATRFGRCR